MLYDVLTNQFHQEKMVQCPGCSAPQELAKITESARDHLAHCFDKECPQSARVPPEEACQPWATPLCAAQTPNSASSGNRHIDPSTAKWMKGAVWGLFAASAATTVTLAILNETSVGEVTSDQTRIHGALTRPAWFGVGMTALTLGIALPTTLIVRQASKGSSRSSTGSATVACPIQ